MAYKAYEKVFLHAFCNFEYGGEDSIFIYNLNTDYVLKNAEIYLGNDIKSIPIFCLSLYSCEELLKERINPTFVIATSPASTNGIFNTANTFCSQYFAGYRDYSFIKVKIGKDYYYVNNGLVMDTSFNPLMSLNLKVKFNEELYKFEILEKVLKVNRDIYSNTDTFSKFIKGTLIPNATKFHKQYFSSWELIHFKYPSGSNILTGEYPQDIQVEIVEYPSFIKERKPDINFIENANEIIKRNIKL